MTTAPLRTQPFALSDFPWAQAGAAVLKQRPNKWVRQVTTLLLLVAILPPILTAESHRHGFFTLSALPVWCAVLGWAAFILICQVQARRHYGQLAASPHRSGRWTAEITEAGLGYVGLPGAALYPWSALHAIRAVPGGLAVQLNLLEFLPISAAGFADQTAQDAFLQAAAARISAARKPRS